MLNVKGRAQIGAFLEPVGRWLAKTPVTPDMITIVGTIGVVGGALGFYTRGVFLIGTLVITAFIFSDLIDGTLARARGTTGLWGAFLDSALDRVGDAAIFGALVWWYAGRGNSNLLAGVALYDLVTGSVTSYLKARAEGLDLPCQVGIAERAERLLIVLFAAGFTGMGLSPALPVALWALAVLTTITVGQRFVEVHRQALLAAAKEPTVLPAGTL